MTHPRLCLSLKRGADNRDTWTEKGEGKGRGSGTPAGTLCRSAPLSPGGSEQTPNPPLSRPKPGGTLISWQELGTGELSPWPRSCLAKCPGGGLASASMGWLVHKSLRMRLQECKDLIGQQHSVYGMQGWWNRDVVLGLGHPIPVERLRPRDILEVPKVPQ